MTLTRRLAMQALVLVAMASSASAQGWLADRARSEGPGFRVGNLELHPGLGLELGYDTNVFYEDTGGEGSFILRTTAHIDVATLGPQRRGEGDSEGDTQGRMIDFRGGLAASYYHFFIDEARDNVGLGGNLALTINPGGRFSVYVHDEYERTIRPFVDRPGTEGDVGRLTYAKDRNTAGLELRLRSPGSILEGRLGYDFLLDYFEDEVFQYVNSFQHQFTFRLSWRFLPRTSLISLSRVYYQDYFERAVDDPALVQNNWRAESSVGINGALTSTLGVTAMVGYAAGFYDDPATDDFDSVIASAALKWNPRRTIQTVLGYNRRFRPSYLGNYLKSDQLYLKTQFLFGGAFLLGADLSLSFDETGIALTPDGEMIGNTGTRQDVRLSANLFGEYRFTDWLGLNLTLGYYGDFTDYEYDDSILRPGEFFPDPGGGFQKFEAWFGLRVFY